ncbi:MAG: hypothetical protein ACTTID_03625 [Bacillales bacterium]
MKRQRIYQQLFFYLLAIEDEKNINISKISKTLKVSRKTLYKLVDDSKYCINKVYLNLYFKRILSNYELMINFNYLETNKLIINILKYLINDILNDIIKYPNISIRILRLYLNQEFIDDCVDILMNMIHKNNIKDNEYINNKILINLHVHLILSFISIGKTRKINVSEYLKLLNNLNKNQEDIFNIINKKIFKI